jgi:hypothetical protein
MSTLDEIRAALAAVDCTRSPQERAWAAADLRQHAEDWLRSCVEEIERRDVVLREVYDRMTRTDTDGLGWNKENPLPVKIAALTTQPDPMATDRRLSRACRALLAVRDEVKASGRRSLLEDIDEALGWGKGKEAKP